MNPKLTYVPTDAATLPAGWIEERREIVARDGYALRASPKIDAIEIKSLHHAEETWLFLALPNGGTQFTTTYGRDAVLAKLQGESV